MTRNDILTMCTAVILGGAMITGSAYALGNSNEKASNMGSAYSTKNNAFFDRSIDTAVKHVREADIAGNQGHAAEMLKYAQLSLDQAKQAQRAGNVPGLNEGIVELREVLRHSGPVSDRNGNDKTVYDSAAGLSAACPSQMNANGIIIYDDPTCLNRYRESLTRTMPACEFQTDMNGTVIYLDPACPARNHQSQAASLQNATAHIREARIKLSQAGGIRVTDAQPNDARPSIR